MAGRPTQRKGLLPNRCNHHLLPPGRNHRRLWDERQRRAVDAHRRWAGLPERHDCVCVRHSGGAYILFCATHILLVSKAEKAQAGCWAVAECHLTFNPEQEAG